MSETEQIHRLVAEAPTASWLTHLLRAAGHLESGEVRTVSAEVLANKSFSHISRLSVRYSAEVPLPTHFVLKASRLGVHDRRARRRRWREHEFYASVVPAMDNPPTPRSYATRFDPASLESILLLEDLSLTHARPPTPLPSTPVNVSSNVDCLAAIHAWWWNYADLGNVALDRDMAWIRSRTEAMRGTVTRFMAAFAQDLPATSRAALEAVSSAYDTILTRSAIMPLTIVHGDAHPWNFLSPIEPGARSTVLLDWEGWSIEPGPHDLTSLLALHLPIETRGVVEEAALEHYVCRLHIHGVGDYDLETCREDYRRSVARRVFSPVALWARGSAIKTWRPMLERITAAYHQLQCGELL